MMYVCMMLGLPARPHHSVEGLLVDAENVADLTPQAVMVLYVCMYVMYVCKYGLP